VSCNLKLNPALQAVIRLHSFERLVFVLSILEGYSNHECSVLLGLSVQEITAVKIRALKNLTAASKGRLLDRKASGYWADTLTASNAGLN
jgi:DNA-directed RNA polymerase specialized sigma24 family protein